MIKTILATSIIALGMGMGTGAAFAQERTFSAWGHDFSVSEPATGTLTALAPEMPMHTVVITGHQHHAQHRADMN